MNYIIYCRLLYLHTSLFAMFTIKLLSIVFCGLLFESVTGKCPCDTPNLCKPVTKLYTKELAVFGSNENDDWKQWNWTEVTHVIIIHEYNSSNSLLCYAHSKNVRVTILVGLGVDYFPQLSKPSFRKQTMTKWINTMLEHNLDGLNIDIEGAAYTKDVVDGISAITNETYLAVKAMNPNYIVTFDVPYSPFLIGCISGYCFDYLALSKATDYLIVMDYDATIDRLLASANSPFYLIKEGYELYINNVSVSPQHLVMAVPWYGYDYTCSHFYNETGQNLCVILESGGGQKDNYLIYEQFKNNIGGLKWNSQAQSPYFTTKENGTYHQFQFDNVESLIVKFKLAQSLNLRGLSMWNAGSLNYTSSDPKVISQTSSMWDSITEYFQLLKIK